METFTKYVHEFIAGVFFLVGVVMVGVGAFSGLPQLEIERSSATERIDGVVVDYRGEKPYIEYSRNGETAYFLPGYTSDTEIFEIGERVPLVYNSESEKIYVDTFVGRWIFPFLFLLLGSFFLLIGVGHGAFIARKKKSTEYAKRSGIPIVARFIGVEKNHSINMNGRHPFFISAQWHDKGTDKVYVFKSENMWFDPTEFIKGEDIEVRIDPKNPKRYWVNTSFLPKKR